MAHVSMLTGSRVARIANPCAALIALLTPLLVLANGPLSDRWGIAAVSFLMVAAPVAVGIYAQRNERTRRFGVQLVLVGCGLFVTTLAHSDSSLLYTVARTVGWGMEVAIIYVLCAYPTGRLEAAGERLTVAAGALLVAVLYLPTVLVSQFPAPSPWSTCVDDCPDNAFAVASSSALVDDLMHPARSLLATAIFAAAALVLTRKVRRASPLARTSLTPVLGVAIVRFAAEAAFVVLRGAGVSADAMVPMSIAVNLTIPLMALGFLAGLLHWRLRVARSLERLSERIGTAQDPGSLEATLRSCLEDPMLRLYLPEAGEPRVWRSVDGSTLGADAHLEQGRSLCPIVHEGRRVAWVRCDLAICQQPSLVVAIGAVVASFLERERLTSALQSTLAEIDASRTRIAAAADETRRRIERDIHDGTQQRLIALRIRLELVEAEMAGDPERAQTMLRDIGPEVEAVIAEVRDLSRGIYPPLLVEAGPVAAIGGVAARLPVDARVEGGLARREQEAEAAVYFCCVEAIQNAIKHSPGLGTITITFGGERDGSTFEVADDGCGFDVAAASGAGITNMRDRLAAVGGELHVTSSSAGTRVRGSIPPRSARRAPEGALSTPA